MEVLFGRAEFSHIAANECGAAFAVCGEAGEDFEGVFHRGGIGVVAIVYDCKRADLQQFRSH